jgi:hypothetical protein
MADDGQLDWHASVAGVRGLEGRVTAVRIAMRHRTEELIADFVGGQRRAGDIVLIEQADVVVNLRPFRDG